MHTKQAYTGGKRKYWVLNRMQTTILGAFWSIQYGEGEVTEAEGKNNTKLSQVYIYVAGAMFERFQDWNQHFFGTIS